MSERKPDTRESAVPSASPARKCPTCGKPQDEKFRPFCSKRCADIDLGRWLKGSYAIPAIEPPEIGEGEEGTD